MYSKLLSKQYFACNFYSFSTLSYVRVNTQSMHNKHFYNKHLYKELFVSTLWPMKNTK